MIRFAIFCLALASPMVSPSCAVAQMTEVAPAQLMRVTEGVFALTPGKSIDLTSEKILLTMSPKTELYRNNEFYVSINGRWRIVQAGAQIDLKAELNAGRQRNSSGPLSGKDHCVLDVIDFVEPRGGIPTATFRLNCL